MSLWLLSSVSVEASGINGDTGDSSPIDVSSSKKVSGENKPRENLRMNLRGSID